MGALMGMGTTLFETGDLGSSSEPYINTMRSDLWFHLPRGLNDSSYSPMTLHISPKLIFTIYHNPKD
jgi:hypothetical protein